MITISKDMEVGIVKIDEQHKELVDRVNALSSMGSKSFSKEETQKTLDFLGKYVAQHFADEEALQKECNYPKYEGQKEIHQKFVGDVIKVKEEYKKNGASLKFTLDLNRQIISWIVRHITCDDVEFGKFYASHT
jgi:hemerythrin